MNDLEISYLDICLMCITQAFKNSLFLINVKKGSTHWRATINTLFYCNICLVDIFLFFSRVWESYRNRFRNLCSRQNSGARQFMTEIKITRHLKNGCCFRRGGIDINGWLQFLAVYRIEKTIRNKKMCHKKISEFCP